jgi:transcription factor SFP1
VPAAAQSPESSNSPSKSPSPQPATPTDSNYQLFAGPRTSLISAAALKDPTLTNPIVIATSPSPSPPPPDEPPIIALALPEDGKQQLLGVSSSSSVFADRHHPRHDRFAALEEENRRITNSTGGFFEEDVEMTTGSMMDPTQIGRPRQESSFVTKPISMMNNPLRDPTGRQRRESVTGSMMAGMSWGGMSFGSFVRDDILMQGTSPSFGPHQSPSFHSSSYLPKLEANLLRDFFCCGKTLGNFHDLLQHYEEAHTERPLPNNLNFSQQFPPSNGFNARIPRPAQASANQSGLAPPSQFAGQPQLNHLQPGNGLGLLSQGQQQQRSTSQVSRDARHLGISANMADEMDAVGEMEMDDPVGHMEIDENTQNQRNMYRARQMFGQQPRPQLQINNPSGLSQALRTSQPPTPAAQNFGLQHDPTVSSVNTPTLVTQAQQEQQLSQTSFMQDRPTSAVLDHNAGNDFARMGMSGNGLNLNGDFLSFNAGNAGNSFCIDDPAKALFSPGNPNGNNSSLFGNSTAARNLQQQLMQHMNISQQGLANHPNKQLLQQLGQCFLPEENKPFKCPVIGCEKAYKNMNGLKYHKAHGHSTQQLHDNADGTFSIVNPETSAPYPGTLGMEKEKPFSCDMCCKRYKNLNGLKYHKSHSIPCNPELKLKALQMAGLDASFAGLPDGLPDIGEMGDIDGMPLDDSMIQ